MKRLILIFILLATIMPTFAGNDVPDNSTRKERNYIRQGNSLYNEKRFADAEVAYRKALEENAASEVAMYNLATSLIRQSGNADPNSGNNPMQEATGILQNLAQAAQDASIAEKAFYNMGNIAFNQQQYDQAINMYKGALRKNPDNDKARENLRLAQLKQQEQQNQDQNKDNKDQKDKQDKQDQNDQQDKQDNQDQNKDQNQDQNKQPNQDKKDEQKQQPQQQQGGISNDNANKILKAMENEENATRRKVQEQQKKEAASSTRIRGKQW